jgi:hypothetical protein
MYFSNCTLNKMAFSPVVNLTLRMDPKISFVSLCFRFSIASPGTGELRFVLIPELPHHHAFVP